MLRFGRRLIKDESAAVAATVAMTLFGLIAAGGIAFDYARMATLDTELQNAADQAALAGATQLDGSANAIINAKSAARGLVTNITRLANDAVNKTTIDIPDNKFKFYNAAGVETSVPVLAAQIQVGVTPREVFYALTPIVGALKSGPMNANARAGLQTSICNVPPLYVAFDGARPADLERLMEPGTGVLMLGDESASHFGYLDTGNERIAEALAWDDQEGICQRSGLVIVKTGVNASVKKAFNTRFETGNGKAKCPIGGECSLADSILEFARDNCHANGNLPKIPPLSPCNAVIGDGKGWKDQSGGLTRYQTYKNLIAASGGIYNFDTDRRRLTVAVVPYGAFPKGSSTKTPVIPTKWLDVFVTERMTGSGNSGACGQGNVGQGNGKGRKPVDPAEVDECKAALHFYVEVIGVSNPSISGRRDVPYLIR